MSTMRDVATLAGVGVGTVSRVLNESPLVSAATRQKVLAAIEQLDYHPNPIARGLSLGRTLTIGVVVPFHTTAAYYPHPSVVDRLRGIVARLSGSRYNLAIFNVETPAQRDEHFRELARGDRADGLLIVSLPPRDDEVERFQHAGLPVVLVDTHHPRLPRVVIDDVRGGALATRHLLALGHRRIAFVGDPAENPYGFTSSLHRQTGYLRALAETDSAPRSDYIKLGPHGRQEAQRLAAELLALPEPPTAIFAASDIQALGVIEAAEQAGRRVPADLSVIGFDDLEIAAYLGLTTVRQPLHRSGVRGAELLLPALDRGTLGPSEEVLPLELAIRRTTGPPVS